MRLVAPLALLASLTTPLAWAQGWLPVGPPGGDVRGLAADPRDPRILYLGTADGVLYKSQDGGRSWARLLPGFPERGCSLDDILVDPRGRVLVGYWEPNGPGGGVARSLDGGRSFGLLPGIASEAVRSLALAPSNPDLLLAGTMSGVFRSEDGGAGWQRISRAGHPEIKTVGSLAVDPADPARIYAGTWHLAWKTLDGGGSWHPIAAGMVDDSDVMTLTLDRRDPETVYATACTGIYRSRDAGKRWGRLRGIPTSSRRTRAFAQDPERPHALYAGTTEGLWASEDEGVSWRRLTPRELVVNAIVILPGGTLLLGTEGAGLLRSEDRGASWRPSNEGFSDRFVSRVLFDAAGQRVLAAVQADRQHGGVFVAPSLEGPWAPLARGLEGREVRALALAGETLLAGTDDGIFLHEPGAWRRLPTAAGGRELHPRVAELSAVSDHVILAASSAGLLRSDDAGASWSRLQLGASSLVSALAVSALEPGRVLGATPLGIWESRDGGVSWLQASQALAGPPIRTLAFLPGSDRVVFATTSRGLLRSDDAGRNWGRLAGLARADIAGLALHPDGRTLYASDSASGGVYWSPDAGDSWKGLPGDGLVTGRLLTLALDPAAPQRLLAAGASGGLHLFEPRVPPAAAAAEAGSRP